MKWRLICLCSICFLGMKIECVMLKRDCLPDEIHKFCAFRDEYTCWVGEDEMERLKNPPKRLPHCVAGCFCKQGLVRAYPGGPCIPAAGCRNRRLQSILKNLPKAYSGL